MKFLYRWVITGLALFAAASFVPGIHVEGNGWMVFAVMALILSTVNALIRPLLKFLSCPLIILTLGLFTMIINAGTFLLASTIAVKWFNVPFTVDGFWPAFWGALVVSLVSVAFNLLIKDDDIVK